MRHPRPLRIGLVAPLWMAVPPRTYGGIERHLHLLANDLVDRGHTVALFATADSHTKAELRPVCADGVAELMDRGEAHFYEHYVNANVAAALRASDQFDVLHFHVGSAAVPFECLADCPVVHTLHTGIAADDVWMLRRFPHTTFTALTRAQIDPVPDERRASIRVVPYGIDFKCCESAADRGDHLVFLGRMAPHKGPDEAIRIARTARRPLWLAGTPLTPDDRIWFEREIGPHVDGSNVRWVGSVQEHQKDELFRRAIALLFPIRWEEPFGLVMLEAIARGVPVIACGRGSVPEVIDQGQTGWYGESPESLAAFVDLAATLDRKAVREQGRRRFSYQRTTQAYLEIYESLVVSQGRAAS